MKKNLGYFAWLLGLVRRADEWICSWEVRGLFPKDQSISIGEILINEVKFGLHSAYPLVMIVGLMGGIVGLACLAELGEYLLLGHAPIGLQKIFGITLM